MPRHALLNKTANGAMRPAQPLSTHKRVAEEEEEPKTKKARQEDQDDEDQDDEDQVEDQDDEDQDDDQDDEDQDDDQDEDHEDDYYQDSALIARMEAAMLGDNTKKGSKKAANRLLAVKRDVQVAVSGMVDELEEDHSELEELEELFDFNHRERVETWIEAGRLTVQGLPRTHQMVVGLFACKMNETLINQLPDGDDLIDRLTHEFDQVDQLDDPDFTNPDFLEQMAEAFEVEY